MGHGREGDGHLRGRRHRRRFVFQSRESLPRTTFRGTESCPSKRDHGGRCNEKIRLSKHSCGRLPRDPESPPSVGDGCHRRRNHSFGCFLTNITWSDFPPFHIITHTHTSHTSLSHTHLTHTHTSHSHTRQYHTIRTNEEILLGR